MKYFGAVLFFLFLLFIVGAGFFIYRAQSDLAAIAEQEVPVVIPSMSSQPVDPQASDSARIPGDWLIFASPQYGYTLRYPLSVRTEMTTEGDRFLQLGPSQSLGTELYDGLSVLVRSGNKEAGKELKAIAEQKLAENKAAETTQSVSELREIKIGRNFGYTYHLSAFGDADYIYLQSSPTTYLEIINSTVEPEGRPSHFQQTVELMLSSINFGN